MPVELTQQETDPSIWGNFILAAGLADAVSRTVTAPIDQLKTRLQVVFVSHNKKKNVTTLVEFSLMYLRLFTLNARAVV